MRGSHDETVSRLEGMLREVECELLYLINDLCADEADAAAGRDPVRGLEIARHCVSAAEKALKVEATAGFAG